MATLHDVRIEGPLNPRQAEQIQRGYRARAWLDGWAKRWAVEDAEALLTQLQDKAREMHELLYALPEQLGRQRRREIEKKADAIVAELESMATALQAYIAGGVS